MHLSVLSHGRSFGAVFLCLTLVVPALPLEARTRKADRLLAQASAAETHQEWDKALDFSEQAVRLDPADPAYQLSLRRVRFEAGGYHVTHGQQLRSKGQLAEALAEFEHAYQIDPSSDIAEQEIRRTRLMIERERKKALDPNAQVTPETAALTPAEAAKRTVLDRIDSLMPVPELKPLNSQPITLRMNNQKPKILFDTVGKLAGINVLFDPDYDQGGGRNQSIDLNGTTLEAALDYVAVVTHSFWKPMAPNTIFVTQENPTKRREYEDQVVRVFYLSNVTSPQELQEVITTLRQVIEVSKLFNYSSQNAIIVRAEPDRMALVEKIIADLDKPKAEVLVDVIVMEVNSSRTRQLAAAFAPNGISSTISFTPRTSLQTLAGQISGNGTSGGGFNNNTGTTGSNTSTGTNGSTTNTSAGTTTTTSSTGTSLAIPLGNLRKIDGRDYSLTNVPGGLLEAIMSDTGTRVMQRPQIRAVDNFKASLKIGDRVPTATGSYQPGVGGVGINPLVNTQFTYLDTGVNLEITPRVHDNGEVSLHMDIDISQVKSYTDIGGISQPIIGQRKATLDVRMRDGQINVIGGLIQLQDSKTVSGVPGLSSIPILRRLFTSEQTNKDQTELLISLVPHIVRGPDITENNLRGVFAGSATNYQVRYAPKPSPPAPTTSSEGGASTAPPPTVTTPPVPKAPGASPAGANPVVVNPPTAPLGGAPAAAGAPPVQPPAAKISFAPGALVAQSGSSFTVTIRAEGAANLQSIESNLKFDPKVLKINSIAAGDLLQQNGLTLLPQRNILNDTGDASASLVRDPSKGSVSGSGSLLVVTFQAIGKGQTAVTMPKTVLHDATGTTANAGSAPLNVTVK